MDSFDADVLIYAAVAGHELGRRVRALFPVDPTGGIGFAIGSVLLVPELLTKPLRDKATDEVDELSSLLGRLDLLPTDEATAELATALGASYGLRAVDAVHLATAVGAGADRFLTNNRSDFSKSITEIDVVYPDELAEPEELTERDERLDQHAGAVDPRDH
ncbi:MAG: type II toxin-antitoxin system VapC family toxin [Acidimicrobiales bacterium]